MSRKLALLICAGLTAGLVLAEIGARLILQDPRGPQLQWSMPEDVERRAGEAVLAGPYGSFTYDENGFRIGSGLPYDQTILFIGDSFTEGFGVSDDETFARATERALRRAGYMVRSLNAGHRGFGAAQELQVLRRILDRFPVDAIVMESFPMNDLSDNLGYGGFAIDDGRLVEYDVPKPPWRARALVALSQSWLRNLYVVRAAANVLLVSYGPAPYDSPTSFDLESALLREMISTARSRGIPIVILVVPTKLMQKFDPGSSLTSLQIAEVERFERVRALVRGFGVPWVDAGDIIPNLEADAAKSDGAHFSKDGNARVGEAIAHTLQPFLRSQIVQPPGVDAGQTGATPAGASHGVP